MLGWLKQTIDRLPFRYTINKLRMQRRCIGNAALIHHGCADYYVPSFCVSGVHLMYPLSFSVQEQFVLCTRPTFVSIEICMQPVNILW